MLSTHNLSVDNWYSAVRRYTRRLVAIASVSPGAGEIEVAEEVHRLLAEGGLASAYTAIGFDPIEHDPYQRRNAYAFLRGRSAQTLVLLGHIDTVDTADYGSLQEWALDPDALAARQDELCASSATLEADLSAYPRDWMFGRGSIDMKSGVAANIALMRRLAEVAQQETLPLSVVLLATPDEENESAGVLQAVRFLLRLRQEEGLTYAGAINTDYTTALYPGDPHRYVYTGSTGKLLPSFLVVGRESHVCEPFDGLDANLLASELIRQFSMCDDLCDVVAGQATPPPVTLHATDLKAHYDVQIPFMAAFSLNVLTLTTDPAALLQRLCSRSEAVLASLLQHIDETEQRWTRLSGNLQPRATREPRSGVVLTYAELYAATCAHLGKERVDVALADEWQRCTSVEAEMDKRERSLRLVRRLWTLSDRHGPAVVIYFAPPYYPHVRTQPCALHAATAAVVAAHPELRLEQREIYPFISDMSYLRLEPGMDLSALTRNMPVWQEPDAAPRPGAYSLPLQDIEQLNMPVVNFGPYGRGAHQSGERVLMSYSFGALPQLLYETIERLSHQIDR